MINETVPTQDEAPDSSSLDLGNDETQLDEQLADDFANFLSLDPEIDVEEPQPVLEDSEENEQDTSDDESVESDEADTETQDELSENDVDETDDADYEIVDYDEVKDKALPVKQSDGTIKHMTLNQIQSELGQARATNSAQKEMKAKEDAMSIREEQIIAQEKQQTHSQELSDDYQQLGSFKTKIDQVGGAMQDAKNNDDVQEYNRLEMHMKDMTGKYNRAVDYLRGKESNLAASREKYVKDTLQKKGYGDLNSDTQRYGKLKDFANTQFSPHTWSIAQQNPEILMALEMARLHTSAGKEVKKVKIKGSGKTMKAGAKTSTPSKDKARQNRIRSGNATSSEMDEHILASSKFFS